MPLVGRRERFLDGKTILQLWAELDSLPRVARLYQTEGKLNPRTGQPFSQNAYWRAASKYLVDEPEEAREIFKSINAVFTDEQWELYVLRRAVQIYKTNRSSFLRWVIQKEWPRKYEPHYKDVYNVKPEDYDYFTQLMRRMPKRGGRQSKNSGNLQK